MCVCVYVCVCVCVYVCVCVLQSVLSDAFVSRFFGLRLNFLRDALMLSFSLFFCSFLVFRELSVQNVAGAFCTEAGE